jgi:hypothetical protein
MLFYFYSFSLLHRRLLTLFILIPFFFHALFAFFPCSFPLYLIHPPVLLCFILTRHTHPSILRQVQYSPAASTNISPSTKYRSRSECLCLSARCVRIWCVRQNNRSSVATRSWYLCSSISPRLPHCRSLLRHKNITVARPKGFISCFCYVCYTAPTGCALGVPSGSKHVCLSKTNTSLWRVRFYILRFKRWLLTL